MHQILLVEDESDHAELICRSLSEVEGEYDIAVASTLSAARRAIQTNIPDMALVDNRLPDGEGVAMVEYARDSIPIVIMTAYGTERAAVQAMKAGALDYIVKSPETLSDMRHVVERAMRGWNNLIERKKAELSLHQSESLFRSVWEKSLDGMRLADANGVILLANTAFCRLAGMSRSQLEGRSLEVIYCTDDRQSILDSYRSQYRSRELEAHAEQNIALWDGRKACFSVSNSFIDDNSDTPRVLSVFRDETARKADEARRLELERKIQHTQKLESLGVLAGGIAHDFNNLLAAILGNTELALLDLPPHSDSRAPLHDAIAAAKRASLLTHQMLAYAGKARFAIGDIDLNELLKDLIQLLKISIFKSTRIDLRLCADLPHIQADTAQIQQVAMNLVTNASEALGENGGMVTITTSVRDFDDDALSKSRLAEKPAAGRFVVLEVKDDGCGMNESVLQRLFDPFFTTKFDGRGLGMSAVLGVIRGHKGAIMIHTSPGSGTVMQVLFPASLKSPAAVEPAMTAREVGSAPSSACKGLFLIVDDEKPVLAMVKKLVVRLGYEVLCAEGGEEAVRHVQAHKENINCVLLDYKMPGMDGLQTFAAMRAIQPGLKVILASGYDADNLASQFESLGFAAFMQKPFHIKDLTTEIQKTCQRAAP